MADNEVVTTNHSQAVIAGFALPGQRFPLLQKHRSLVEYGDATDARQTNGYNNMTAQWAWRDATHDASGRIR